MGGGRSSVLSRPFHIWTMGMAALYSPANCEVDKGEPLISWRTLGSPICSRVCSCSASRALVTAFWVTCCASC